MDTSNTAAGKWAERASAPPLEQAQDEAMYQLLFERSQRSEQALRESRQLLESIADNISEAIYRSDPDHRLTFVNQAYLRLFGYDSLEELQAIPRERLYRDPSSRLALLESLERDGFFCSREVEYVRRDGSCFWGLSSGRAIRDPLSGRAGYHVGSIADITSRKAADAEIVRLNQSLEQRIIERTAELSASEARLRTLIEHAPEAIVVLDGDTGRFLFGNSHACRLYGCGQEFLPGLSPGEVSPEFQPNGRRSEDYARERINEALAGGTAVFEWVHRHPSGRAIPVEVRLVRLPGEARLLRASVIDNTERHRRQRIQQTTFDISQAVLEAHDLPALYGRIHEIIGRLMPARNFYIAQFDQETETISFPYFVDEFTEQPKPRKVTTGLTGEVLRTGKPTRVTRSMHDRKHRVGEGVVIEGVADLPYVESGPPAAVWLGVPLRLQNRIVGVMAVQDYREETAYDDEDQQLLTFVAEQIALAIERKRAEAELLKAYAREKELNQLKSNFVSMVSHEFRTPLGVILSSAEILDAYFEQLGPDERREQLRSIQMNTRRMASLMEEVLLLGMVEAGKLEYRPDAVDLELFCARVLEEVASATDQRCPIMFHPSPMPREPRADERLLHHIFSNLLNNAVKYSTPGSPVDFELYPDGPHAVFRVRDRGVGIPSQERQWLFRAFHRGSNVGNIPGTGLGLTLVKRCVELHHGSIRIDSEAGRGTLVTVRLPLLS